jgi:ribosomal protein L7Ae-like RNA K-turn-binding protein
MMGPDDAVAIDLKRRSGGRGAHVCCRRECLELMLKKRRLGRALRVDGVAVETEALLGQARDMLWKRICHFLALCQKSGRISSGADGYAAAFGSGQVALVVVASDVSPGSLEKIRGKPLAMKIPIYELPLTREALGGLLGKGERAAGAVRKGPLADALLMDLKRLKALTPGGV